MKRLFVGFIVFFLTGQFLLFSQGVADENGKMEWWRDAKFGMFIHWGIYSVFGNVYNGLDVNGEEVNYDMRNSGLPAEWIMYQAKIPRSVYREAANEFDAKDYNPRLWVQIAKDAGMKYIIITSKHHDGFCLFDSQYTDWDAVDASAAKRDLLEDLVSEARAAGLKIGFYYSQNLDWMHEGGMGTIPELDMEVYPHEKIVEYVNNLVIPHIRELADKYDFDVMWFDGQYVENIDPELNETIYQALKESPVGNKIISNDRLCLSCERDYETPETDTPDIPYNGFQDSRDWEACASLNNSWGYEGDSESYYWQSPLHTISRILELTSKGGNLLLNVGPDKHGVIPRPAVNTLKGVGEWMKVNGEAVYGTEKNQLINPFEYGYVTQKTTPDGRFHWYLHVSSGYWNEGKVYLYGIKEQPRSAVFLADGAPAAVVWNNNIVTVNLPETDPNQYYTTIDLCFDRLPEQMPLAQIRNNQIRLTPYQAVTNGIRKDFEPYVFKEWYRRNNEIRYNIYLEPGTYTIQVEYAALETGELYFSIDGSTYTGYYSKTDNYKEALVDMDNYTTGNFSHIIIQIQRPDIYQLVITRNAEIPGHFNIINVRNFTLNRSIDTSDTVITTNKILLYPNPVRNGYFYCTVPQGEIISIYDATGRLLKSCVIGEDHLIDVSDLRPGIYLATGTELKNKLIIAGK
ncbi:MAG: alpha-L-fucosidase [Dysgonamonadaceae bacterium]|jgi:alpha-L-fucosidase|nr:alpha-L-fucosidase [Dysgonamonadaceae bacterium]